jgi:hypothetical protein
MTHSSEYKRILNKMGYYNYQNRLIFHHLNQEGGWDKHLEHCRNFIIRALEIHKPETVTVLGSGWLLDLPLAELTDKTGKICLIDIIHPPDVINQVSELKNVELMECDVTGGLIEEVWQKTRKYSFFNKLKSLENIIIPEFSMDKDPGMVISLNILTQLESQLIYFLKRRSKIKEEEFNIFRSEIQKKHLDFLNKHRSVLVTDRAEVITKKSGSSETITTLVTELPPSLLIEEWTWNFDQTGADLYNSQTRFEVVALVNL